MTSFRVACAMLGLCAPALAHAAPHMDQLRVPQGFTISLISDHVPNARGMARGARGTIFVGTRAAGVVYALTGIDGGGPVRVRTIAHGLDMPVGVAYHDGDLYVCLLYTSPSPRD